MKLQLCSLEFWRSLAHPSPAPPPPCQLEYPLRPREGRGGQGGRAEGEDPPGTLGWARRLSTSPGIAQGFKCPDGPSRSRWHPRDPALLVAPSRPQLGAGSEKPGKSRLESLDRVKRADIERAKTPFTRRSPPRGSGTSASVKILSNSEGAGLVISPKFQGNIHHHPPPHPYACFL